LKKLAIALVIIAALLAGTWYGTFSLRRARANDYLETGNKYFAERNDREAILEYKKGAFLYPTSELYFALGQVYFLNQNLSRAETYFKNALAKSTQGGSASGGDPNHAKAAFGLSETYLYQEKYDEALRTLEEKNSDDSLINIGLTRIYLSQEEDEKAEKQIENSSSNLSRFYQAKILLFQEQYHGIPDKLSQVEAKDADERTMLPSEPTLSYIKILEDAIRQSLKTTNDATRKVILGEVLNQTGDAAIALPILKKVAEENSTYRDAYVFLGHSYLLIKKFDQAKDILLKAIDLDPIYYPSWLYLGEAYEGLGNEEVANNCYEKAKELK